MAMTKSRTATKETYKVPQAKCLSNQPAIERLARLRAKSTQSNFSFTLKRAMETLMSCKEHIASRDEALALPFVGPHIARIIVPSSPKKSRGRPKESNANRALCERSARQQPPPPPSSTFKSVSSTKQTAYRKAQERASDWRKFPQLQWRVVLLIDGRERKSNHMQAKCQMSGIPAEERHLPIGDMTWVAQGMKDDQIVSELVLGTIIERKTMEDFKASLFGTRYAEQRLRLKNVNCPQVLFLVEGDTSKDQYRCPADTLQSAFWETRLHIGFSIVHTRHMDETVKTLKRMHRRILQRSFPESFSNEALPIFSEADARGTTIIPSPSLPRTERRRVRRRIQSLMDMTFDTDPMPPLGVERFLTYDELKSKVELDREMGRKTVGSVYRAMLKQVPLVSSKKCHAVAQTYPTTTFLVRAFDEAACADDRKSLLSDIMTTESDKSTRDLKIGPRSATELFIAYGRAHIDTPCSGNRSTHVENAVPSSIPTYSGQENTPATEWTETNLHDPSFWDDGSLTGRKTTLQCNSDDDVIVID